MRFLDYFKKSTYTVSGAESSDAQESQTEEEVTTGTKVKIVLALMVVGFAGYVAYWVQEPSGLKADVLNGGSQVVAVDTQTSQLTQDTQTQSQAATQAATQTQTQTQVQTQEVAISNFSFDPQTVQIDKGVTVLWTNKDAVPHTITGDSFSSGPLSPGQSFSYTFADDGTFAYHCSLHPQMTGSIIVGTGVSAVSQQNTQASTQVAQSQTQAPDAAAMQAAASEQAAKDALAQATAAAALAAAQNPESFYASAQAPGANNLHNAAVQPLSSSVKSLVKSTKLANSGPEDYIYLALGVLVLFLNRKKLAKMGR
ncbi:MAG: cupredoxin family copper-binding protein [Candidatus Gracilibacteria bacterium]|jgi:plastocyanin